MIPVRIKLPLYIRKGPGKDYEEIGVIQPSGSIINMDGVKEDGHSLKGISKWYYKLNDKGESQWYWGGRIEETINVGPKEVASGLGLGEEQKYDSHKMSWAHDTVENGGLGIVKLWNLIGSKGQGVRVTVIDSGIGTNITDLGGVRRQIYAPKDGGNLSATDPHGTLTAGVIGGLGKKIAYGIAPESEITVIKRENKSGDVTEEDNFRAFQAVGNNTDILNLSITCDDSERIKQELTRIANQGTLIIVATDDAESKLDNSKFPANHEHPNIIPVTALDRSGSLYWQALFNSRTNFILPGEHILTCGLDNEIAWHNATSAATPVMTGLLALFFSARILGRLSFTNDQLLRQLVLDARKISVISEGTNYTFFLPNPLKTYSNLVSQAKPI